MREIKNPDEIKKILVESLKNFDHFCRRNNIKYSLIGGSLIGAIRHKGMIPWDDDIDVVLTEKEYKKFLAIINKNENYGHYKFLIPELSKDYYYPFVKMVDTRTYLRESELKKEIPDYGVYIDIFSQNYMPDDIRSSKLVYKKMRICQSLLALSMNNKRYRGIKKKLISLYARMCGPRKWLKLYNFVSRSKNAGHSTVVSNWPAYGYDKEVMPAALFSKYIDCDFNGVRAMISAEYDEILRRTFGDYMTPPSVDQQKTHHNMKVYWKTDN